MKTPIKFLFALMIAGVVSCNSTEEAIDASDFTGDEIVYELFSASDHGVAGTLTFKERIDQQIFA